MAFRVHRRLTDFLTGSVLALLLQCAPIPPRVNLYPSGVLVITTDTWAPADYAEEMARCAAKHWGVDESRLAGLTIKISRGYGVECPAGRIVYGCYVPATRTIVIADSPTPVDGGVGYLFPEVLFHELTHWAMHEVQGDAGDNGAEWFYRPTTCY